MKSSGIVNLLLPSASARLVCVLTDPRLQEKEGQQMRYSIAALATEVWRRPLMQPGLTVLAESPRSSEEDCTLIE